MTILYNFFFILFSLAYLPYLIFTGRYHKDFWQRFGFYPKRIIELLDKKDVIWVHAVSVGEVMASCMLLRELFRKYPDKKLVISTVTKTGNMVAKKYFKDKAQIIYLPVDISTIVKKTIDKIKPELFIIIETELWPNLITALEERKIPIIVINGRISPKSYKGYMRIRFLIKGILNKITLFSMQNDEYKNRIEAMGAPKEKVIVTGSMKFDAADRNLKRDMINRDAIRSDLNLDETSPLFIAGSTHRPEEKIILEVYKELLKDIPNLRLLIAPRHIERTGEITRLIRKFGFTPVSFSALKEQTVKNGSPVLLLDTMGRLNTLFSIATIVFMGGSLLRKGGQNILEAAQFEKPIIFGPHMFNFKDIAELFLKEDAACRVKNKFELLKTSRLLLNNSQRREKLGSRAKMLVDKNKGATRKNIEQISKILGEN